MALSIFDPATGINDPNIGQTAALDTPNPFLEALKNRNVINLLAGIGSRLDPKGVGGALGGATLAFTGAQAAQERAASSDAAQSRQTQMLLDAISKHGGLTPPGTPGITSAAATDDGINLKITGDLQGQGGSGSINDPITQEVTPAPGAPPAPGVPPAAVPAPVPVATTPTAQANALSVEENKKKLPLFSHIFSALRG